jgi:hypothetical protein
MQFWRSFNYQFPLVQSKQQTQRDTPSILQICLPYLMNLITHFSNTITSFGLYTLCHIDAIVVTYKKSSYTLRALKELSNTTWGSPLVTTLQSLNHIFHYSLQIQTTTDIHCVKHDCQMQLFVIAQGVLTVLKPFVLKFSFVWSAWPEVLKWGGLQKNWQN